MGIRCNTCYQLNVNESELFSVSLTYTNNNQYLCALTALAKSNKDIVEVSVVAKLNSVLAAVCNADRLLADILISGLLVFTIAFHSLYRVCKMCMYSMYVHVCMDQFCV